MPEFIIRDGRMLVGKIVEKNEDGSITVDLYRNMRDYETGAVMELDFVFWPSGLKCPRPRYPDCYPWPRRGWSSGSLLH